MSEIRLDDADAQAIAGLHKDAHDGISGTGDNTPGTVDAGLASAKIGQIISLLVTEADDLAVANLMVTNIVNAVADDFYDTDAAVSGALHSLHESIP